MPRSTAQLRNDWKAFLCKPNQLVTISFGTDLIRVAPGTEKAWAALYKVLEKHGYMLRNDDTDSYNCRQITDGEGHSLHSFGIALDVNWTTNPYRKTPNRRKVRFSTKPTQQERAVDVRFDRADTDMTRAMIDDVLKIKTKNNIVVFEWGGDWKSVKDPMHFELDLTPAELAVGLAS